MQILKLPLALASFLTLTLTLTLGVLASGEAATETTMAGRPPAAMPPASAMPAAMPTAPVPSLTEQARTLFWTTLHDGNYAGIADALELAQAAAQAQPADAEASAHLGWLHLWHLAERRRAGPPGPDLANDVVAARQGFERAVALRPDEARYLGFYATTLRVEGDLRGDDALAAKGEALMQDAVQRWPEFNLFTAGYPMGSAAVDSPEYHQAVEALWRNMEACTDRKWLRSDVDFTPVMALEQTSGPKRACWNSWIAPHNFEGFFLALGDMLVKEGDWQTARRLYANARLSADYAKWPYREVLERRIAEAPGNVDAFRHPGAGRGTPPMMIASDYACMACHQAH